MTPNNIKLTSNITVSSSSDDCRPPFISKHCPMLRCCRHANVLLVTLNGRRSLSMRAGNTTIACDSHFTQRSNFAAARTQAIQLTDLSFSANDSATTLSQVEAKPDLVISVSTEIEVEPQGIRKPVCSIGKY